MDSTIINKLRIKSKNLQKSDIRIYDLAFYLLMLIPHKVEETLYLTMSIIDLYKEIINSNSQLLDEKININQFTSYLTKIISGKEDGYKIRTKKFPVQNLFQEDKRNIRQIDIDAPEQYGITYESIQRIKKNNFLTDKVNHDNATIKMALYSENLENIILLDNLSSKLNFYDTKCNLIKTISPEKGGDKLLSEMVILNMAWSERQKRLGIVLKDFSIVMWESSDNFKFQKNIETNKETLELQINIWYLHHFDYWLTCDNNQIINIWDIATNKISFSLKPKKTQGNASIIEIIEMPILKMIAVSSMDRSVSTWNLEKQICLFRIDLSIGGIHTMKYFQTYSRLLTVGFSCIAQIYNISPEYRDLEQKDQLKGHVHSITALEVIEKTPMVLTSDDKGTFKLWDIRTLKCLQTIELGKMNIKVNRIISIYNQGRIGLIGQRLYIIDFEERNSIQQKQKIVEKVQPLRAVQNLLRKEIAVCTRKDVRFLDVLTGKTKYMYIGLLNSPDDEITEFLLIQNNQKFIIGTQKGQFSLFCSTTGQKLLDTNCHTNECSSIKADPFNDLIISSSHDSTVKVQKINSSSIDFNREITNVFNNRMIIVMEIAIYHNIVIFGTDNCYVCICDYEFIKLIKSIKLKDDVQASALKVLEVLPLIVIGTNDGMIYLLSFTKKDLHFDYRLVGKISIQGLKTGKNIDQMGLSLINAEQQQIKEKRKTIKQSPYKLKKSSTVMMEPPDGKIQPEDEAPLDAKKSLYGYGQKILVENNKQDQDTVGNLIISTHKGYIIIYDMTIVIKTFCINTVPDATKNTNYYPFRKVKDNIIYEILTKEADLFPAKNLAYKRGNSLATINYLKNIQPTKLWKAHKDFVEDLQFFGLNQDKYLTCGLDGYVQIWDKDGDILSMIDMNHPLPTQWDINKQDIQSYSERILQAIDVLDQIFNKYKIQIHSENLQNFNIGVFLQTMKQQQNFDYQQNEFQPQLMSEQYDAEDIYYSKYKLNDSLKKKILGPTLKNLQKSITIANISQAINKEFADNQQADDIQMGQRKKETEQYLHTEMNYLLGRNYKQKLLGQKLEFDIDQAPYITDLQNKLELITQKNSKKSNTKLQAHVKPLNQILLIQKPVTIQKQQNEQTMFKHINDKFLVIRPFKLEMLNNLCENGESQPRTQPNTVRESSTIFDKKQIEPLSYRESTLGKSPSLLIVSPKYCNSIFSLNTKRESTISEQSKTTKQIDFYQYAVQKSLSSQSIQKIQKFNCISNIQNESNKRLKHVMGHIENKLKCSQQNFYKSQSSNDFIDLRGSTTYYNTQQTEITCDYQNSTSKFSKGKLERMNKSSQKNDTNESDYIKRKCLENFIKSNLKSDSIQKSYMK